MEKVEIRKSNNFTWNVNNWISFSEFLQVFTLKKQILRNKQNESSFNEKWAVSYFIDVIA